MLRRVALVSSFVLVTTLLGCKGGGGGSGGGDDAPPPADDPKTTELTPKSDEEGAATFGVSAGATDKQLLKASATSAIAGTTVAFPPGSLGIDVDVTVEQGVSLDTASLEGDLGVGKDTLTQAGPAVVVTSEPKTDGVKPFTVSIVTTQQAGLLATTYVIVHKSIDAATGKLTLGVIPTNGFQVVGNLLVFETTHFGVFQAFLTSVEITEKIEKDTSAPIETIRDQGKDPGPGPGEGQSDKTAPLFVYHTGPGTGVPAVDKKHVFKLVFNEAIDPLKANVTGTMRGSGDVVVTAVKTTKDNDTLVIAPKTNWVTGNTALNVKVKDRAGNDLSTTTPANVAYEVVDRIYYVHPTGTEVDADLATAANPLGSIQTAASRVSDLNEASYIYVAKGNYVETFYMFKGVRVLGGFTDDKTWKTRIAKDNLTKVTDDSVTGSNVLDGPVICADGSNDNPVAYALIDGLSVHSHAAATDARLIEVGAGHECRITNCVLRAQGTLRSIAVGGFGASVTLVGNDIAASDSATTTFGLSVENISTTRAIEVIRNKIIVGNIANAGMATLYNASPIYIQDGAAPPTTPAVIHDNVLRAGDHVDGHGGSYGVHIYKGSAEIRSNTIVTGIVTDDDSSGGFTAAVYAEATTNGNSLSIDNNILVYQPSNVSGESSYGVLADSPGAVKSLRNNAFFYRGPPSFAEYLFNNYMDTTSITAASTMSNVWTENIQSSWDTSSPRYFENFADNKFKITGTDTPSPKLNGLNGKDQGWNFGGVYKDVEGNARAAAGTKWTIGAYE